jgi:hypothetical protein
VTFSKNYLSAQSQPWAREVQKRLANLEATFRSAEVNNTTRDDQLAASFRRLDAAFSVLAAQQEALAGLVQDVSDAADAAAAAASAAGIAATTANNAIDRLETYTTEYYPINASASFNGVSGTILSEDISVPLSTLGGGNRDISAIAICSVDAGVNSPGGVDDTPHRLTLEGRVTVGGTSRWWHIWKL